MKNVDIDTTKHKGEKQSIGNILTTIKSVGRLTRKTNNFLPEIPIIELPKKEEQLKIEEQSKKEEQMEARAEVPVQVKDGYGFYF